MINAIEKNLCRGVNLLNSISDEQYSNTSTPPYYSSIGTHIRHILDIFNCIFIGLDTQKVNFSQRERNPIAEKTTSGGIVYFKDIISKLKTLSEEDFKKIIFPKLLINIIIISLIFNAGSVIKKGLLTNK